MPTLKLIYFPMPGRNEPTCQALTLGGVKFEKESLEREAWGARKEEHAPLQLPLLEVGGRVVSQSVAQLRYAGKISKYQGKPLYPEDAFEALLVDELVDQTCEIFPPLVKSVGIADKKEQLAFRAAMVKPGGDAGKWAVHIDAVLAKSKSGFALLDRLTIADVAIFSFFNLFRTGFLDGVPTDCLDHLEHLKKHRHMMAAIPQLKEYYKDASGPFTVFQ